MEELFPDFLEESKDVLEKVRTSLGTILECDNRASEIDAIYRGVHTIKGGAAMFGLEKLREVAHGLETYLSKLKEKPETLTEEKVNKIQGIVDSFDTLLMPENNAEPGNTTEKPEGVEALKEEPAQPKKVSKPVEMIRVPVDRIQQNFDTVSEIFLIRNQMNYLISQHLKEHPEFKGFHQNWEMFDNSLRRRINELEHVVMSMRMMPLKNLFSRMEQTVRSYCTSTGKKIKVQTSGEETELDKKILDSLGEPLIHLIRNAMDHGIEGEAERLLEKKPDYGLIKLSAKVVGNEVVIEITDDGKGIDAAKVKASAEKKGIDTSFVQNDDDAVKLIFMPGFSTAEQVSEVSGRGVGMDAVRNYVEEIGGTIDVKTRLGKGSTFILNLPLGMSVIPAILVKINGFDYALSTNDIIETKTVDMSDIGRNEDKIYLKQKDKYIPCYFLNEIINKRDSDDQVSKRKIPVCIANCSGKELAFCVDELELNTEIVLKPLSHMAPHLNYISGVSVLPTGKPIFVLSLGKLYRNKIERKIQFNDDGVTNEAA